MSLESSVEIIEKLERMKFENNQLEHSMEATFQLKYEFSNKLATTYMYTILYIIYF